MPLPLPPGVSQAPSLGVPAAPPFAGGGLCSGKGQCLACGKGGGRCTCVAQCYSPYDLAVVPVSYSLSHISSPPLISKNPKL